MNPVNGVLMDCSALNHAMLGQLDGQSFHLDHAGTSSGDRIDIEACLPVSLPAQEIQSAVSLAAIAMLNKTKGTH